MWPGSLQGSQTRGRGAGSPVEVLPDSVTGSIIVYISIYLKMLYMLLKAPHHEPEQVCVLCAHAHTHTHLILKQRKKPTLFGLGKEHKEPKQMHRIKVFFKLTIWLIAPKGTTYLASQWARSRPQMLICLHRCYTVFGAIAITLTRASRKTGGGGGGKQENKTWNDCQGPEQSPCN